MLISTLIFPRAFIRGITFAPDNIMIAWWRFLNHFGHYFLLITNRHSTTDLNEEPGVRVLWTTPIVNYYFRYQSSTWVLDKRLAKVLEQ